MGRLKRFKEYVAINEARTFKKGCVMLYFDAPFWGGLESDVGKADLFGEADGKGFEHEPHVTILYGIKEGYPLPEIMNELIGLRELCGQELVLGKLSAFKNEEFDVLKFDTSDNAFLFEMNSRLSGAVEFENDYPEYKPHCTVAYLRPGTSDRYIQSLGGSYTDLKVVPKFLVYSQPPDGQKTFLLVNK